MAYTALYRKWRPARFEDVRGQEHIVRTLKNQIISDRVGHAYLFCGTRGTGKTTIAKIMARAVNCEHPVDGSPCNECAVCRSILEGRSVNVAEIDAASNNGVDNIREIRDQVQYSPTEGKYRVYIIDEVHMLSAGAFNALLKTLEEPPAYVIFILATTEANKIPITVLSRCQRYDFRRIGNNVIADQVSNLLKVEGVEADEDAVYEAEYTIDLGELEPTIAFPHLPENTKTISQITEPVVIDQSVIGSCTNGRIDDLRVAAQILKGRKVKNGVRCIVIPATQAIYLQAMDEGLLKIFIEAGAVVSTPTCGPCLGGYMGILAAGERCISTTNRNFVGRMGHVDSEVYLASPAVAAASAVTGKISAPEELGL